MDRVPVSSSHIRSVGFDRATLTLDVEFTNGRVYRYLDGKRHPEAILTPKV